MAGSLVVRTQLTKTIKTKRTRIKKLQFDEVVLRNEAVELLNKWEELQAEVNELETHLDSLGGPVEKEVTNG